MADAPPLVAIKEANVHLQALHEKNVRLEKEVADLRGLMSLTKEQEQRLLGQQQIINEKDKKIEHLENKVIRLAEQVQDNSKKDLMISQLGRKVKILNEVLKYKSALESIAVCLEQVEEDFIVDIDNMVQVSEKGGAASEVLDVKKLNDPDHETSL